MSPDRNPTLKILLNDNIEILKFKSSKEEYEKLNTSMINILDISYNLNVIQELYAILSNIYFSKNRLPG